MCFSQPKKNIVNIELHHGARKNIAALRTVRTIIHNLIIGVTKGFRYKMRYVYAHFPINVNIEKNGETGLYEVEIRYVVFRCLILLPVAWHAPVNLADGIQRAWGEKPAD